MAAGGEDRLLVYARELEDADRTLARAVEDVELLRGEVRVLRERAHELELLLARLPAERAEAEAAVEAAEQELARRRAEVQQAEADLAEAERSDSEEQLAAARRATVRSRDAAATAGGRRERALLRREELERDAAAAQEDAPRLEAHARDLLARLGALPRLSSHASHAPPAGLAGVVAWAARAEAALFVARGGLATERERVVREANELAAAVLGEPLAGSSVTRVRERLERG